MNGVYLLHFDRPYKHAKHYLGYTSNLDARLDAHRNGSGARLIEVITEAGIGFQVARVWRGQTRKFERRLKGSHASRLCPICNPTCFKRPHRRKVRFTKAELSAMRRGYRDGKAGSPKPGKLYGAYMRGYRKGHSTNAINVKPVKMA